MSQYRERKLTFYIFDGLLFFSNNTKEIIKTRKVLLEEAAKTDCMILKREANRLGKVIKKEIVKDRTEYFENKFNDKEDSSNAWRSANELLGTVKNLAPTAIIHTEKEGDPPEMIKNPAKLAKIFNEFLILK